MSVITPAADFLVRLRLIEKAKLKARDIVVLYAIKSMPGTMGQELAKKLGYAERSALQTGFRRLMDEKLIEDRRLKHDNQTPNSFYITDAGKALLDQIVPA